MDSCAICLVVVIIIIVIVLIIWLIANQNGQNCKKNKQDNFSSHGTCYIDPTRKGCQPISSFSNGIPKDAFGLLADPGFHF